MIVILKNFSKQEDNDKKMSPGKKLALIGGGVAGILGLTAAGIYHHHQKEAEQLKKQLNNTKNTVESCVKGLNDKIREIEEEKAKVLAKLRTQKGWGSVERSEKEFNKELENLNKKTVDEYLPKEDQIKNTKELDDFMLK